jgi:hypothetical protein
LGSFDQPLPTTEYSQIAPPSVTAPGQATTGAPLTSSGEAGMM